MLWSAYQSSACYHLGSTDKNILQFTAMRITVFILIVLFSPGTLSFAQKTIKQKVFGYYQDGKRLDNRKLLAVMQPFPDAYDQMRKAQNNYTAGLAIGIPGTLLLGGELIRLSRAETLDELIPSAMTYIGLPLSLFGSYFLLIGNLQRKSAVKAYNNSIHDLEVVNGERNGSVKPVVTFTAGIRGVALEVRF